MQFCENTEFDKVMLTLTEPIGTNLQQRSIMNKYENCKIGNIRSGVQSCMPLVTSIPLAEHCHWSSNPLLQVALLNPGGCGP